MIVDDAPARTYRMSEDAPARTYRMSAELRDDPAQVTCLRDYFEDVLDQIYPRTATAATATRPGLTMLRNRPGTAPARAPPGTAARAAAP